MSTEESAKIFEDIVKSRKSVRAFKSTPVEPGLLKSIFTTAQQAPSNCNTQPWQVHVVSGDRCEYLRELLPKKMAAGDIHMDFPYDGKYDGIYRDRQYGAALTLYDALGIKREEKSRRAEAFDRNYVFFDAPHVAFIFMPSFCDVRESADIGMYAQTLMLALQANGIASCPQTALSFHANTIREYLNIDADNKLLFGLSFGYEDGDSPANKARTERADLGETTFFHE